MKKILSVFTLVVILTLMVTAVAAAKTGAGNPKGEITEIDQDAGTVTIILEDGTPLIMTMPEDYVFDDSLVVGMYVVAKGDWTEEGFDAEWVKEADEEEEAEEVEEPEEAEEPEEGDGEGNAWGEGGVYCAGGKEKVHPVAQKIADKYEVDPEWVMSYACDGHGFGGVMLALQTAKANEGGDADKYLAKRKEGKGWGQIWKEDGLVKSDKADSPPPGLLKKPDKVKGPDKDKGTDKVKPPKTNNGKKPDKNATPVDAGEDDGEGD